jgi:hypothetical protein
MVLPLNSPFRMDPNSGSISRLRESSLFGLRAPSLRRRVTKKEGGLGYYDAVDARNCMILLLIMVRLERFELPAFWFVARRSIQLSYRRNGQTDGHAFGR